MTELTGTIERFLFSNTENGYGVMILIAGKSEITVTGHIASVQPGQQVTLHGSWTMHPKYGRQFEAQKIASELPTSILGLKKYLGSGLIKGVGKIYAEKMVNHFGEQILQIIDQQPERLKEIPGIGQKRIQKIATAWQDQKEVANIMIFLQEKNITPAYAAKIYKKYGKESIAIVKENPYRLADDIWGIGFKTADTIAQQLGFEKHSTQRIKAGICFAISSATNNGHLYVRVSEIKATTCTLLEIAQTEHESTIKYALHDLYEAGTIKLITHDNAHFVTLAKFYFAEKGLANNMQQLLSYTSPHCFNLQKIYQKLRMPHDKDLALNEDQQRGILSCFQHKVTIITGGPGTGKTTLIKKLLHLLDEYKLTHKLAAPTGRAAKRMMESTGRMALTIHRLLEFDVSTMSFTHNESNALKLDFLIVDEASMIDVFLAYSLIKALPQQSHVVLIGDVDQLPSVGAGNVLKDLIASTKIPCTKLTHIFRQAQNSLIVVNAHNINQGKWPIYELPDGKKDFIFIKEDKPEMVIEHLKRIFFSTLRRHAIQQDNAAVLVPMNRGIAGTIKLNQDMQVLLNPDTTKKSIQRAATIFRMDDKVMQLRNNYDKAVFNGDIGVIEDINEDDRLLLVRFDERLIEYEANELDELVLAYALSIHKSQGSEYDAVIIPLFMQHFMLLQRNLIYTAITRAKRLCIFIAQPKALAVAIKNNTGTTRQTFLPEYLTEGLTCR